MPVFPAGAADQNRRKLDASGSGACQASKVGLRTSGVEDPARDAGRPCRDRRVWPLRGATAALKGPAAGSDRSQPAGRTGMGMADTGFARERGNPDRFPPHPRTHRGQETSWMSARSPEPVAPDSVAGFAQPTCQGRTECSLGVECRGIRPPECGHDPAPDRRRTGCTGGGSPR